MKPNNTSVLLIYTGGTIGMFENPETGALENFDFEQLQKQVPELQKFPISIDSYQFNPPIDSSDMNPDAWRKIVKVVSDNYDRYTGFVVLHGTDTMAYTASALSFMLEDLGKPVILTGSQLPIGVLRTDGKENLITSLELASTYDDEGHPMVPEVTIYFCGHLLRGNRATKCSAEEFTAFKTFNYPHICDAGVDFVFHDHHILRPDYSRPMIPHYDMDNHVMVFSIFPGIREEMVRHIMMYSNLRGIVMRTFGSGNAPQHPWLLNVLNDATQRGIVVVNVSQCEQGSVEMARYDTGLALLRVGVISGYDSTVEAAVTKLMHLLAIYDDPKKIRQLMSQSLAGEISV